MTIPLIWNGDDGHSVFVNGIFVGGGGFAEEVLFNLTVNPDAPVKLEVVGYNGPGPFVFQLLRSDTNLPLTSTPGVTINASVPETGGTLFSLVTAIIALFGFHLWQRYRARA